MKFDLEALNAPETEAEVVEYLNAFLESDNPVWEECHRVSRELSEALEQLNRTILGCEEALRRKKLLPVSVAMPRGAYLSWDGTRLQYITFPEGRLHSNPLVSTNKQIRLEAVPYLQGLWERGLKAV